MRFSTNLLEIQRLHVGIGRSHEDTGIGAVAIDDTSALFQSHRNLQMCIRTLCDRIPAIALQRCRLARK